MCRFIVSSKLLLCLIFFRNILCIDPQGTTASPEKMTTKLPTITENINFFPNTVNKTSNINSQQLKKTNLNTIKKSDKVFKPSVHLGEIREESRNNDLRKTTSIPFNHVSHLQFENSVGIVDNVEAGTRSADRPQSASEHVKFIYDTDNQYPTSQPVHSHQPQETYEEGYVTIDTPTPTQIYYTTDSEEQHQHNHASEANTDIPMMLYQKPIKFESDNYQAYEYPPTNCDETVEKPDHIHTHYQHQYYPNYVHPPAVHNAEIHVGKPETVLYLTSHRATSFTRTRKFPYKNFQPHDDTEIHLVEKGHAFPPQRRPISPWHKIIHIIGAFLPLGLLIAALRPPNIINATQPNIVLSKLRAASLPIEHKSIGDIDEEYQCESRLICQSILHEAEKNQHNVENVLWNVAYRSADEEMRKSDLEEIFGAVKKKDCSSIKC